MDGRVLSSAPAGSHWPRSATRQLAVPAPGAVRSRDPLGAAVRRARALLCTSRRARHDSPPHAPRGGSHRGRGARRHSHSRTAAALADSTRAAAEFYRERGDRDEQLDTARQEWSARTAPMRLAAVQADALLRRRHPNLGLVGCYLASFDPQAADGNGAASWTDDAGQAMTFDTAEQAAACYRSIPRSRLLRPDGKPNRPLTIFNVIFD